jgi:hypothetical protein
MRKKKQSFELTLKQTEMLGKFGGASFDYPKLSFERGSTKAARPETFQGHNEGEAV